MAASPLSVMGGRNRTMDRFRPAQPRDPGNFLALFARDHLALFRRMAACGDVTKPGSAAIDWSSSIIPKTSSGSSSRSSATS